MNVRCYLVRSRVPLDGGDVQGDFQTFENGSAADSPSALANLLQPGVSLPIHARQLGDARCPVASKDTYLEFTVKPSNSSVKLVL